jgi:hypothetical protein
MRTLQPSIQPNSCRALYERREMGLTFRIGTRSCCALAATGHVAAAPPSSVRNSRRLISKMARFPPPASAGVSSPRLLAGAHRSAALRDEDVSLGRALKAELA